jgi:5-methylcytosine-specific restriction protein A
MAPHQTCLDCGDLIPRGGIRCPECASAKDARRGSRHARGYGGDWTRIRAAHLEAEPWCRECGAEATDVDHIVPRAEGGTDDDANLQSLCHRHHSRKTAIQNRLGRTA